MTRCTKCNGWIEFRTLNGVRTPIHLSGGCWEDSEWSGHVSPLISRTVKSAHAGQDFCRPTRCPRCRADVFFIRHNGGSVWVDELGWPWPKHGCFDEQGEGLTFLRTTAGNDEYQAKAGVVERVGVVGEAGVVRYTLLAIACFDGHRCCISLRGQHNDLNGQLVTLRVNGDDQRLFFGKSISWEILSLTLSPDMLDLPRGWATWPNPNVEVDKVPTPVSKPTRLIDQLRAGGSVPNSLPPKPQIPRVICPKCKRSIEARRLARHMRKHHRPPKLKVKGPTTTCPTCGVLVRVDRLQRHVKRHATGGGVRPQ
jgi:hypothetical protein